MVDLVSATGGGEHTLSSCQHEFLSLLLNIELHSRKKNTNEKTLAWHTSLFYWVAHALAYIFFASILVSCLTSTLCLPTVSDLSLLYPMIIPGM